MKKICSLLIMVIMIFTLLPSALANQEGKVEISFCVGESTLSINGKDVTVETPYITASGVTLVPLRVITEAFGSEVIWNGEDRSIKVTNGDVVVMLQIDNSEAFVNNESKALLSAPVLSGSGVTMVPLRFISENFGATVGFDDATKKITVVKEILEKEIPPVWSTSYDTDSTLICSSDLLSFSIKAPGDYVIASGDKNEIIITNPETLSSSLINIGIYSKDKVTSGAVLARNIIQENKNKYNSATVQTDTDISKVNVNGYDAREFRSVITTSTIKATYRSVFFEVGEYVYKIGILNDEYDKNIEGFDEKILNSIVLKEIDFSKVGSLGRNEEKTEKESFSPEGFDRCTYTLPGDFAPVEKGLFAVKTRNELRANESFAFGNDVMIFEVRRIAYDMKESNRKKDPDEGYFELDDFMYIFSVSGGFRPDAFTEVLQYPLKVKMGDNYFGKMIIREDQRNSVFYHEVYIGEDHDNLYLISASYPEIHYSIDNRAVFQSIVSGVKFGKQE